MNIFIDTEDMEERYAEGLYKDYLEEQNKQLQQENEQLKKDFQVLRVTNISLNDLVNSCQKEIRNLQQERDKYKSNAEKLEKIILELNEENQKLLNHLATDKIKELEVGKE